MGSALSPSKSATGYLGSSHGSSLRNRRTTDERARIQTQFDGPASTLVLKMPSGTRGQNFLGWRRKFQTEALPPSPWVVSQFEIFRIAQPRAAQINPASTPATT